MRKIFLAAAFLVLACSARAESLWVAEARVLAVAGNCADTAAVGDFYRAIYRPMGTTIGNGADSYLALFSQRSSFVMLVRNTTFGANINYAGQSISSRNTVTNLSGGILSWIEVGAMGAGAPASNVTASLRNFYGTTGCTATLRMPFILLP